MRKEIVKAVYTAFFKEIKGIPVPLGTGSEYIRLLSYYS